MLWARVGVPIATGKKQRTWPEAPVPPRFPFSKPISDGLNREITFENGYRESRSREISRSRRKGLAVLGNHRSREGLPGKIVVFFPVAIRTPPRAKPRCGSFSGHAVLSDPRVPGHARPHARTTGERDRQQARICSTTHGGAGRGDRSGTSAQARHRRDGASPTCGFHLQRLLCRTSHAGASRAHLANCAER